MSTKRVHGKILPAIPMAYTNPFFRPNLDNPDYWRGFARRALTCPMRPPDVAFTAHLAQYEGVDPARAVAMMATFYFPDATGAVH